MLLAENINDVILEEANFWNHYEETHSTDPQKISTPDFNYSLIGPSETKSYSTYPWMTYSLPSSLTELREILKSDVPVLFIGKRPELQDLWDDGVGSFARIKKYKLPAKMTVSA